MSDPKYEIQRKVKEWVSYADDDLIFAQHGLDITNGEPYRQIAFHAQQCVEKYLKAYLVYRGIDFPYTHDISALLKICAESADWTDRLDDAKKLTPYATTLRYPGVDNVVTRDEVATAIEIAVRVRKFVRTALIAEGLDI